MQLKNNGGLISPSDGTISVVLLAERHLRSNKNAKLLKVQGMVLRDIGSKDIFDLGEHVMNTSEGISNHSFSLIRLVVEVFFDLRQHHRIKLHNHQLHRLNVRHKSTKAVIFKGQ